MSRGNRPNQFERLAALQASEDSEYERWKEALGFYWYDVPEDQLRWLYERIPDADQACTVLMARSMMIKFPDEEASETYENEE